MDLASVTAQHFAMKPDEVAALAPYCAKVGLTQLWPEGMYAKFREGKLDAVDCMRVLSRLSISLWRAHAGFDDEKIVRWLNNGKYDAFMPPAPPVDDKAKPATPKRVSKTKPVAEKPPLAVACGRVDKSSSSPAKKVLRFGQIEETAD